MSEQQSYRQIMKATSLFGGVQVFIILVGIIRSKVIAVLLGSTGVGMIGLYQTTLSLIQSVTSFGIQTSAVRDISEASVSNNEMLIGRFIKTFYRWLWITGFLGASVTLTFAAQFSQLTFGSLEYTWSFVWLSIVLLLNAISSGQSTILQGMRKLRHLALSSFYGSLIGLIVSLPMYYYWEIKGVVPSLILAALISLILNTYFSKKLKTIEVSQTWSDTIADGKGMVRLGFVMMLSGFMITLVSYVVNIIISHKGGLSEVGFYRAGWTITMQYSGLIFTAMGTDYFPRLAAIQNDRKKMNRAVNQQAEIAILLLGPMMIAMIGFAPLITNLLYTQEFTCINGMIQWTMLGMLLKAASWSLAFTIIAKGDNKLYFITETIGNTVIMVFNIIGYYFWGLNGIGLSFSLSYLFYFIFVYFLVKNRYNIYFLGVFWRIFGVVMFVVSICFISISFLSSMSYFITIFLLLIMGIYSFIHLNKKLDLISQIKIYM